MEVTSSELGKKSAYISQYKPDLLFPIPRADKRTEIGINSEDLPFFGYDTWVHYEVSWLNAKGKPQVAIATLQYECTSPNIVESKSLKLYFNSFNQTKFQDWETVANVIKKDVSQAVGKPIYLTLDPLNQSHLNLVSHQFEGTLLDELDVSCDEYQVNPDLLICHQAQVSEALTSNLLKSNCLVTHQPDWGSVQIQYTGKQLDHAELLKYIVSFRNHNEFHEQCVERIFNDIWQRCQPDELTICAQYTRRGGIDINPLRSTSPNPRPPKFNRLIRQ